MKITAMTEAHAREICGWRYEGVYEVYNFSEYEEAARQGWSIADARRRAEEFRAVVDDAGVLEGYFRMDDSSPGELELGLGLRPDLCGRGRGEGFVRLITRYAQTLYPHRRLFLEVRTFNRRAVRCYEAAGYRRTGAYRKNTPWGTADYIRMEPGAVQRKPEPARSGDLASIVQIYEEAKAFMKRQGNPTQWGDDYPTEEIVREDIARGRAFVFRDGGGAVCGVFVFSVGAEPNYARIDGAWKNEEPYGTIHRLAGAKGARGIFDACLSFCLEQSPNIRMDTHENNKIMNHLAKRSGFERCGTIWVEDGTPRIAYQYTRRGRQGGRSGSTVQK